MQFLEKSSVLAITGALADDEVTEAIEKLVTYNDDANKIQYGNWYNLNSWQLFEPTYLDGDYEITKHIFHTAICTNCHASITIDDYDSYCPRCGAKMGYLE